MRGHIRFRTSRSPAYSNGPVGSGQRFDQPRIDSPLVTVTDVHRPGKAEGKGPSRVPRRDRDSLQFCIRWMPSRSRDAIVRFHVPSPTVSLPRSQIPEDTASNVVNHHRSCHDRAKAAAWAVYSGCLSLPMTALP